MIVQASAENRPMPTDKHFEEDTETPSAVFCEMEFHRSRGDKKHFRECLLALRQMGIEVIYRLSGESTNSAVDNAAKWLQDLLANGPVEHAKIKTAAKAAGHKWQTVTAAKEFLKIKKSSVNYGEVYVWAMPGVSTRKHKASPKADPLADLLKKWLAQGPLPAKIVRGKAESMGFSELLLQKAVRIAGVTLEQDTNYKGRGRSWLYKLILAEQNQT